MLYLNAISPLSLACARQLSPRASLWVSLFKVRDAKDVVPYKYNYNQHHAAEADSISARKAKDDTALEMDLQ